MLFSFNELLDSFPVNIFSNNILVLFLQMLADRCLCNRLIRELISVYSVRQSPETLFHTYHIETLLSWNGAFNKIFNESSWVKSCASSRWSSRPNLARTDEHQDDNTTASSCRNPSFSIFRINFFGISVFFSFSRLLCFFGQSWIDNCFVGNWINIDWK